MNSNTAGQQSAHDSAPLANGTVIVVWRSAEKNGDIKGQLLDANGTRIGGEFRVNNDPVGNQRVPTVAALQGGGFVVAWGTDDTATIRGQVFTASGIRMGGEFGFSTNPPSSVYPYDAESISIAALPNGNFAVASMSENRPTFSNPGFDTGVRGTVRTITIQGVVGPEILLDTGGPAGLVDAAALPSGNFVVLYTLYNKRQFNFGRIFGPGGEAIGSRFEITERSAFYAGVAALPSGGFAVALTDFSNPVAFGIGTVVVREFGSAGTYGGIELAIGAGSDSSIALLDASTAIVAYDGPEEGGGGERDIRVRSVTLGAQPTRAPVVVNEARPGVQAEPSVVALGSGRFMVIWNDKSGIGDPEGGVRARIFAS